MILDSIDKVLELFGRVGTFAWRFPVFELLERILPPQLKCHEFKMIEEDDGLGC